MPKMKTKKALRKRFRKTATGKVIHLGAGRGHLMTTKSRKRKRNARNKRALAPMEQKRVGNLF
jgi:large subunit ribosomal protein L35